jgi:hypothetical protein
MFVTGQQLLLVILMVMVHHRMVIVEAITVHHRTVMAEAITVHHHHPMEVPAATMEEVHHLIHTDERNVQQLNARNVAMENMAIVMEIKVVIQKRNMVVAAFQASFQDLFHFHLFHLVYL